MLNKDVIVIGKKRVSLQLSMSFLLLIAVGGVWLSVSAIRSFAFVSADSNLAAASAAIPSPTHGTLGSGLSGYWLFGQGSSAAIAAGTSVPDSSGNNINGSVVNGATWVTGSLNINSGALQFNGSNQYVDFGNSLDLGNSSLTLSAWVNPSKLPSAGDMNILSRRVPNGGADYQLDIYKDGSINFASYNGGSWNVCSTGANAAPTSAWTDVTITFDQSSNLATIYVNGQSSKTCTLPAGLASNSGALLRLGYGFASDDGYFNGAIAAPEIWNRALTATEALQSFLNFNISLTMSGTNTVVAGNSVTENISVNRTAGASESVTLSAYGLPSLPPGAVVSFSSPSCNPSCTSTMTITTTAASAGTYTMYVAGMGTSPVAVTRLTSFGLTVTAPTTTSVPTGLTALTSNAQANLSWNAVASATSYNVYRSSNAAGPFTVIGSSTGTSYSDTGLSTGTYYYQITAVSTSGESGPAAIVSATIAAVVSTVAPIPIASWGFSEGSGTTVSDSHGSDTGTIVKASFITGDEDGGHAMSFPGNAYISFGNPADLNFNGSSFTVSAWFNSSNYNSSNNYEIVKGKDAAAGWGFYDGDFFVSGTVGPTVFCNNNNLPTGQWVQLVGVVNAAAGTVSCYKNGMLSGSNPIAASNLSSINNDSGPFCFGARCGIPDSYYTGSLDNVNIYKTALSASQVATLYTGIVVTPPTFDFSLSNSGSATVSAGKSISDTISSNLVSGTAAPVTFSISGLPSGVTSSFTSSSCSPACSTTLNMTTASSMSAGSFPITVTGTSGSVVHTTSLTLNVGSASTPPSFNFSLSDSNSGTISVTAGAPTSNTITSTLTSGTAATVVFSVSGLPSGAAGTFTIASCLPTCSTTLNITTTASTAAGSYPITVTGTSGSISNASSFTLKVSTAVVTTPPFVFSVATAGSQSVTAGNSVSNTITSSMISGIAAPVAFSVSGLPSGAIPSFSQNSCTPTCSTTLNITTSALTPAGSYTAMVNGAGTNITATSTFGLTVSAATTGTAGDGPEPALGGEAYGPFNSWIDITKAPYNAKSGQDDTAAINQALADVGTSGRSPVLYFPSGTYLISGNTTASGIVYGLHLSGKQGISIIGQDPATTIFRYTGSGGSLFWLDGIAESRVSRITFDGNYLAQVAFDQSCVASGSNCTSGPFDIHNEYTDDIFEHAQYGFRCGYYGAGCSDNEIIRGQFYYNTQMAVTTVNQNALQLYIWDSYFQNNNIGVSDHYTGYGTGGQAMVYRSTFVNSTSADVTTSAAQTDSLRGNTSYGSNYFLQGGAGQGYGESITLQDNTVINPKTKAVSYYAFGPFVFLDNKFISTTGTNAGTAIYLNGANPVDALLIGNSYTSPISVLTVAGASGARVTEINPVYGYSGSIATTPPPPQPALTNYNRHVIDITNATGTSSGDASGAINAAITASCQSPYVGNKPVVHIPYGWHNISSSIVVPASCDVQLIGDGMQATGGNSTMLVWNGPNNGDMIDLAGPSKAVVSDMELYGNNVANGIVVHNADQSGGRVYVDDTVIQRGNTYNLFIDRLDKTYVEGNQLYLNSNVPNNPTSATGLMLQGGPNSVAGNNQGGRVDMFTGSTCDANLCYNIVSGRYLHQDFWDEQLPTNWANISGYSMVSLDTGKMNKNPPQINNQSIVIHDLNGQVIINEQDLYDWVVTQGGGTGNVFVGNTVAIAPTGANFFNPTSSTISHEFFNNENEDSGGPRHDIVNSPNPVSNASILAAFNQIRTEKPTAVLNDTGTGNTNVAVRRVFFENQLTGMWIRPD